MTIPEGQSIRVQPFIIPLAVWVVMAIVAVINGGLREVVIIPRIGDYPGHVVSTAMLAAAILVISFLFFSWTSIEYSRAELILVGVIWMLLTIGFEFLVGYLEGTPVSVTLGQDVVLAGQVWIAIPITLLLSPLLFGWYLAQ